MTHSPMPSPPAARRAACRLLAAGPALAATPKDTLVVAWAIDDIITMDPAESFEISAGEIMGNTYDRLIRFDVSDPSRLLGDTAKTWTVSPDGKTYSFELKDGLKFASGNPLTAEDVVFSLAARRASRQDAGLHPHPVRLHARTTSRRRSSRPAG